MDENPILGAQIVETAVAAGIGVVAAFKPGSITDEQRTAILTAVGAFWLLGLAILQAVKPKVVSLSRARDIKSAAWRMGREEGVGPIVGLGGATDTAIEPTLAQVETYARRNNIRAAS